MVILGFYDLIFLFFDFYPTYFSSFSLIMHTPHITTLTNGKTKTELTSRSVFHSCQLLIKHAPSYTQIYVFLGDNLLG